MKAQGWDLLGAAILDENMICWVCLAVRLYIYLGKYMEHGFGLFVAFHVGRGGDLVFLYIYMYILQLLCIISNLTL